MFRPSGVLSRVFPFTRVSLRFHPPTLDCYWAEYRRIGLSYYPWLPDNWTIDSSELSYCYGFRTIRTCLWMSEVGTRSTDVVGIDLSIQLRCLANHSYTASQTHPESLVNELCMSGYFLPTAVRRPVWLKSPPTPLTILICTGQRPTSVGH